MACVITYILLLFLGHSSLCLDLAGGGLVVKRLGGLSCIELCALVAATGLLVTGSASWIWVGAPRRRLQSACRWSWGSNAFIALMRYILLSSIVYTMDFCQSPLASENFCRHATFEWQQNPLSMRRVPWTSYSKDSQSLVDPIPNLFLLPRHTHCPGDSGDTRGVGGFF